MWEDDVDAEVAAADEHDEDIGIYLVVVCNNVGKWPDIIRCTER